MARPKLTRKLEMKTEKRIVNSGSQSPTVDFFTNRLAHILAGQFSSAPERRGRHPTEGGEQSPPATPRDEAGRTFAAPPVDHTVGPQHRSSSPSPPTLTSIGGGSAKIIDIQRRERSKHDVELGSHRRWWWQLADAGDLNGGLSSDQPAGNLER